MSTLLIVAVSLLLFTYWFRYSCLLALRANPATSYAPRIAAANRLNYLKVQSVLSRQDRSAELDQLHEMLLSDYRLVSYLSRHGSNFRCPEFQGRRLLLRADFRLMQFWYFVVKPFSLAGGGDALREMADIIRQLAQWMGEQAALHSPLPE